MSQVVPFPRTADALPVRARERAAVMDARQVTARPDLYTDKQVLDACDVLACWGDWIDHTRATQLRAALMAEPVKRSLPWWVWCLLGAAALALGALLAEALIGSAEAAAARQIAEWRAWR